MKAIDSSALLALNRILNLAGGNALSGSETLLEDGQLVQVLDVGKIISRSLAVPGTDGIFLGLMKNQMGAGTTNENSSIDPYNVGALAVASAGYPANVRSGLDVWLLSASIRVSGGTAANFVEGIISLLEPITAFGWGVDEAGAAATGSSIRTLARFDAMNSIIAARPFAITEQGEPSVHIGQRIRRGATIDFDSEADNAVDLNAQLLLALLPSAFGQDVLV